MSGKGQPIDQLFNEQALEAQADRVRSLLVSVTDDMKAVQNAVASFKGSNVQPEIVAGTEKLNSAIAALTETNSKYKKGQQELVTMSEQLIKSRNAATSAVNSESEAVKESAKAKLAEARAAYDTAKANEILEKSNLANKRATEANAKAAELEEKAVNRSNKEKGKAIALAKQNEDIPFTHNLNSDGTINESPLGTSNVPGSGEGVPISNMGAKATSEANDFVEAEKKVIGTTTALNVRLQQSEKAILDNIVARKNLELANSNLAKDQKEDLELLRKGIITQAEYNERIKLSTLTIERNRVAIGDLTKTIKTQAAGQVGSNDLKEKEISLYRQLVISSKAATDRANEYALSLGKYHPVTKQAQADALALRMELKALGTQVGDTRLNVGNYAEDIEKTVGKSSGGLSKAYGLIRTAAYMIPGIGIAGIFGAIAAGIGIGLDKLGLFSEKLTDFAKNLNNLNEVVKAGNKEGGSQITTLKLLYDAATDVTLAEADRLKAAKELQREYPTTFKNFSTEQIMLGEASAGYAKLTQEILKTATAKAAKSKLDELEAQRLDIEFQKQKIRNAVGNEQARVKPGEDVVGITKETNDALRKLESEVIIDEKARIKERGDNALKEQDKLAKSIIAQEKFLIDFVGQGALIDAIAPDPNKIKQRVDDLTNELIKAEQDRLKAVGEMGKLQLDLHVKRLKSIGDDESNSISLRLIAYDSYSVARKIQVKNEADFETKELRVKADKIAEIEGKAVGKRTAEEKKLLLEKKSVLAQLQLSEFKASIEIQSIEVDFINKRRDIRQKDEEARKRESDKKVKDAEEEEKRIIQARKRAAEDKLSSNKTGAIQDELEGLKILNEQYQKGAISLKEYNEQKTLLARKSAGEMLLAESEALATEYTMARNAGDNLTKIKEKIAANALAIEKHNADSSIKTDEEITAKRIKNLEKIMRYEEQVANVVKDSVDAGHQNEINRIQDEINLNTKAKDQRIKDINDSSASAVDKANQIIIATAAADAKENELNQKKKDEQLKQAKFDKEYAMFQIGIRTGMAVLGFLSSLPPNVPGAIGAGITGALELAAVAAKPLPHFVKGGIHAGGPLIWGEEGRELAIEPGGKTYFTPATESVGYAPAGTKIIPADIVNDMWQGLSFKAMTGMNPISDNGAASTAAIQQVGRSIVKELQNRPPNINRTEVNMDRVKYISTNIKN